MHSVLRNRIGEEGATAIVQAAQTKPQLTTLCGIKPEQTEANLNGSAENYMGPAGAILLTADLAVRRSLNSIDVGYNFIDQAAVLELLAAMKEKAMVSIGMAYCELGVEGAKVVAEMAAVSRSLSRLLIGFNAIGDTGCIALAEAMQQNDSCKIEVLGLNDNKIELREPSPWRP